MLPRDERIKREIREMTYSAPDGHDEQSREDSIPSRELVETRP